MRTPEQIGFYKTQAWKRCRENYFKAHSLCEVCLQEGLITPGRYVHHKIHVSQDNLADHSILTNPENLQTLCRKHHEEAHPEIYGHRRRYCVDDLGRVIVDIPPS